MNNKLQIFLGLLLGTVVIFFIPYIHNNFTFENYTHLFLVTIYLWGITFSFMLIVDAIRNSLEKGEVNG